MENNTARTPGTRTRCARVVTRMWGERWSSADPRERGADADRIRLSNRIRFLDAPDRG
jgi:hypothetical protein